MAELFKQFQIPDDVDDVDEDITYGTAPMWDFDAGDFVLDNGRIRMLDGYAAWVQWCVKTTLIPRYAHVIYPDDYGTEFDDVQAAATRQEAEDRAADTIRDALLQDPRTGAVGEFDFTWNGDELTVAFTVEPTIGTPARVAIALTQ